MTIARILGYLLIVLIPASIILGNFNYLILNRSFYQSLYGKVGTYQNFENQKIVNDATNNLFGYFRGKNTLDHNFFSTQAVSHLKDVRDLLVFANGLFYLSLIAALVIAISLIFKRQSKIILESLFVSSIATIFFIAALGLGISSAFDSFFLKFHQILFTNTLWLFPADDNLIKLFPEQFFVEFANQLALNIFLTSSIIAIIVLSLRALSIVEGRGNLKQFDHLTI